MYFSAQEAFSTTVEFVVHGQEDLAFVHTQRLNAVLIGVGVNASSKLGAGGIGGIQIGNQAINGQYQVATNESAVEKKPRLHFTMVRS